MKAYNTLNEDDKLNIINLFNNGKEVREIPLILNVSERATARVLKESGINTKCRNRYSLNENYFETINTPEKAYILGLLYADGYVGDERYNNIVLSLSEADRPLLEQIAMCIGYTGEIRKNNRKNGYKDTYQHVLNFSNKKMTSDLRKLGLYPGKSASMTTMPILDKSLVSHFIRGYFDGDGSVYSSESTSTHIVGGELKTYTYQKIRVDIIGTESFMKELISHIPVTYAFKMKKAKSENMVYMGLGSRKSSKEFYDYIYKDATIYMQRKYEKFIYIMEALLRN